MELNVRIQKSLILDFDLASAKQSALEDWKIDVERELIDKQDDPNAPEDNLEEVKTITDDVAAQDDQNVQTTVQKQLENIKEAEDEQVDVHQRSLDDGLDDPNQEEDSISQIPGPDLIEYERLSEFFFDLCLSWCQHLDIETYIFFLNGIFLNITEGSHINVSVFKEIDDIEVLSVEFFNKLLNYRTRCEEAIQKGQTYADWYSKNFGRSH